MGKQTNLHRALGCALLLAITSTAHAQDDGQEMGRRVRSVARVIVSDDIGGQFAEPECHDGELVRTHATSAFTGVFMERGAGSDEPLVVDAGGLLTPHGVARFAARDLPDTLVQLVVGLGYDALALGEHDLGAPRARMIELARRLGDAHVPYVASNLSCDGAADALCDTIVDQQDPPFRIRVGAENAAFLAFLDTDVLQRVAPDRREGITIEPIPVVLPEAVRVARLAGATLVVAVLAVTSDEALTIARRLPPDARPDVLVLAGEGDELLFARPATVVPPIVSAPPGSGVELLVGQSDELRHGFEMLARPLELEGSRPAPPVDAFVEAVGHAYCEAWGRALPGGHLAREIGPTEIAELAARIVREHAHADVSFLNIAAIDESFVAATPTQLSASDFYIALSYDEPIVVADVSAEWLAEAQSRLASHRVVAPGLGTDDTDDAVAPGDEDNDQDTEGEGDEDDDDPSLGTDPAEDTSSDSGEEDTPDQSAMRVRGRPAVSGPGASYRVATIRFLAEGGDGSLPPLPAGSEWHTLGVVLPDGTFHYDSLRDVVIHALEPEDARDPRDARPSPNDTPEWVVRGSLDGNFAGSSVSNPAMYEDALLATDTAISLGAVGDVRVDATAPDWTWENRLLARYRTQWTPSDTPGEAGKFVEASDQIQLRTLLSYRGWRPHPSEFYIPDAYAEAFIESEFTRPDGPMARQWHWFLVRPTVGLRFPLATELSVKLQAGFQSQVFAPDGAPAFGLGASVQLRQWQILNAGGRSLTADGYIDFFDVSFFDQAHVQVRGQLDLALDLAGPLAITLGTTLYLQQDGSAQLGTAIAATAGLRLSAVTRVIGP